MELRFCLKMTDKQRLFIYVSLGHIFLKMKKVNLPLQGKQPFFFFFLCSLYYLLCLLPVMKFEFSGKNSNFGNLFPPLGMLTASQFLNIFLRS